MTSHLLDGLKRQDDKRDPSDMCVFCDIIERKQPAHIVSETEDCLAFLDILPIRAGTLHELILGHVLVVPKAHVKRISDLSAKQSAALLLNVVSVARAMEKGTCFLFMSSIRHHRATSRCQSGICPSCGPCMCFRLMQVHFHIVPAPLPDGSASPLSKYNTPGSLAWLGRRDELSDEEGSDLATRLQTAIGTLAKL